MRLLNSELEDDAEYAGSRPRRRLWGIEPEYWDIWGKLHVTTAETKQAILRAMGAPVATEESLEQAIAERRRKERDAPGSALPGDQRKRASARKPRLAAEGPIEIEIVDEEGSVDAYRIRRGGACASAAGRLPLGYHDVAVAARGPTRGRCG